MRLPALQIDNLDLVEEKWKAITKAIPDEPVVKISDPVRAQQFNRRIAEARAFYPVFFDAEKLFWSSPANLGKADVDRPVDFDHQGFALTPEEMPNPSRISTTGRLLLQSLDEVDVDLPEGVVDEVLLAKINDVWQHEKDAMKTDGCKSGRDDSVLTLYSSAESKPVSRTSFNPVTDVAVDHIAIVNLTKEETPGQRGWEAVKIVGVPDDDSYVENQDKTHPNDRLFKVRMQIELLMLLVLMQVRLAGQVPHATVQTALGVHVPSVPSVA
jgi:hypothetical protein